MTSATPETRLPVGGRATRRWPAARIVIILAVLGLMIVSWIGRRPIFHGNLGIVDPGCVFRSAQPTTQLDRWMREYQIRSILNLRGGTFDDWWYADEVKTAETRGAAFYDLPLSAIRRPSRRELLILIDVFERCQYPLLIHCKWGSDRTGLATALYLMLKRGVPPERALGAFSIEFGHAALGGPEHLHEPLEEYAAWLKSHALEHTAERFRDWVMNDFVSDDPPREPPVLYPGPRVRQPQHRPASAGRLPGSDQ